MTAIPLIGLLVAIFCVAYVIGRTDKPDPPTGQAGAEWRLRLQASDSIEFGHSMEDNELMMVVYRYDGYGKGMTLVRMSVEQQEKVARKILQHARSGTLQDAI